ncbi:MAG: hypothetical protein KAT28_03430 [Candidatus Aenigmarchaeota archaeon]|nr:hypothetical protein [Candidatus Aenigmarchaeota archaeon]
MEGDVHLLVKRSCLDSEDKNYKLIYPLGAYISKESADGEKIEIEKRFEIEHVNSNGSTPDLKYEVLTVKGDNSLANYIEQVYLLAKKYCIRDPETGKCMDDEFQGVQYISGHGSKESAILKKIELEERLRQEFSGSYELQSNIRYEVIPISVKG